MEYRFEQKYEENGIAFLDSQIGWTFRTGGFANIRTSGDDNAQETLKIKSFATYNPSDGWGKTREAVRGNIGFSFSDVYAVTTDERILHLRMLRPFKGIEPFVESNATDNNHQYLLIK